MSSVNSPFSEHCEWLQSVRAQYTDIVRVERVPSSQPVGFADEAAGSHDIAASAAAFPEAPAFWVGAFEAHDDEPSYGFSALALDNAAFERDIYRSLDDDSFERPVYRSFAAEFLGDAHGSDAADPPFSSFPEDALDEESQSRWLQKMPPLICRQKAATLHD